MEIWFNDFLAEFLSTRTFDSILLFIVAGGLSAISSATLIIAKTGEIAIWFYAMISSLGVASFFLRLPSDMLNSFFLAIMLGVMIGYFVLDSKKSGVLNLRRSHSKNFLSITSVLHSGWSIYLSICKR